MASSSRPGDIITAVDGKAIPRLDDVVSAIGAKKPGDQVTLARWPDSDRAVTLGDRPAHASG